MSVFMSVFRNSVFVITSLTLIGIAVAKPVRAHAVKEYGDEDVLGTGTYSTDPKAGATEYGLAAGVITDATETTAHGFPFSPSAGDYPGTDQIFVGSNQTGFHDGYSGYSGRESGPQLLSLDYSSLLPVGQQVQTLTLGIAADDFQFPVFGQPYTATINGVIDTNLTQKLNSLDETHPLVHYFTIGVDPSLLTSDNVLKLGIDEGGDGGDGWAVDFLTVGVTTTAAPVPEASSVVSFGVLLALGLGGFAVSRRRKGQAAT